MFRIGGALVHVIVWSFGYFGASKTHMSTFGALLVCFVLEAHWCMFGASVGV